MTRRFWPQHVRSRLTLAHMGALTVALLGFCFVLFFIFRFSLYSDFDVKLRNDLEAADDQLEALVAGSGTAAEETSAHDPENWLTEIWTTSGERVFTSGNSAEYPLGSITSECTGSLVPQTVSTKDGLHARVFCQNSSSSPNYRLRVARLSEKLEKLIHQFLVAIALGAPLIVMASGLLGFLLARRALAPLATMAATAKSITASRLSERLPVLNPEDELGQLSLSFNQAFDSLEKSFHQMKRFTADASHELRTPLTAIRTLGEVTLKDYGKSRDPYETISNILEETDYLRSLCESLLLLSRADSGQIALKHEEMEVGDLVGDVVGLLSVLAEEKRQSIELSVPRDVRIKGDAALLRQVLTNLVDNAIKYSPEGASLGVHATKTPDGVSIKVTDTGPGIPLSDQPRVFDRFYRVDKSRARTPGSGAGLGLAIADWAVKLHGGSITLRSEPGRGSTFEIRVPSIVLT